MAKEKTGHTGPYTYKTAPWQNTMSFEICIETGWKDSGNRTWRSDSGTTGHGCPFVPTRPLRKSTFLYQDKSNKTSILSRRRFVCVRAGAPCFRSMGFTTWTLRLHVKERILPLKAHFLIVHNLLGASDEEDAALGEGLAVLSENLILSFLSKVNQYITADY